LTEGQQKPQTTIFQHFRRTFIAGLVVVLPATLIILGIIWLFELADGILQPLVNLIFGRTIIGLGIVFTLLLIIVVGIVTSNAIGNAIIRLGEYLVQRLPILKQIYSGAKQAMEAISVPGSFKGSFRKAVIVEYPRKGVYTLGFVTSNVKDLRGSSFVTVFLPSAPFPYTGMWVVATRDQIYETKMSFLEALEMVVSWGIILPKHLSIRGQTNVKPSGNV
jgi:uncharacterized membrane protein